MKRTPLLQKVFQFAGCKGGPLAALHCEGTPVASQQRFRGCCVCFRRCQLRSNRRRSSGNPFPDRIIRRLSKALPSPFGTRKPVSESRSLLPAIGKANGLSPPAACIINGKSGMGNRGLLERLPDDEEEGAAALAGPTVELQAVVEALLDLAEIRSMRPAPQM